MKKKFQTKDLEKLRHFLGIEVACGIKGLVLSQKEVCVWFIIWIGILGSKPCDTLMDPNLKLDSSSSEEFKDKRRFNSLLINLYIWQSLDQILPLLLELLANSWKIPNKYIGMLFQEFSYILMEQLGWESYTRNDQIWISLFTLMQIG